MTGSVAKILRCPVKSMQGEWLTEADVTATGVAGDRRFGVLDAETGRVLSAKRVPELLMASAATTSGGGVLITLPSGDEVRSGEAGCDDMLSAWLGRPVRLADALDAASATFEMNVAADDLESPVIELPCPPGTFQDAAPVHLLTTATLAAIAASHSEGEWDVRRFRPTFLVEADGAGFVEDGWNGGTVTVGTAEFRVFAPTVRCAMTGREQPGLAKDIDVVRTILREHIGNLGVYAIVTSPGRICIGDTVEVIAEQ